MGKKMSVVRAFVAKHSRRWLSLMFYQLKVRMIWTHLFQGVTLLNERLLLPFLNTQR